MNLLPYYRVHADVNYLNVVRFHTIPLMDFAYAFVRSREMAKGRTIGSSSARIYNMVRFHMRRTKLNWPFHPNHEIINKWFKW